jgi:homoserine dehydrogenase
VTNVAAVDVPIALLGYGTVGAAVNRLLDESGDDIERATGHRLRVVRALVRDPGRERRFATGDGVLTTDFEEIVDDPAIALVAEVMGGVEPTCDHVLRLLRAGKAVVSANKQLIARRGAELFGAASEAGVQLRFEASVCAAIPVIKVLREALVANNVHRVLGIVNGTTNFVLTRMEAGAGYAEALAEAQRLGYAEADPSEDVDGRDAAAKMAILARLAFDTPVHLDQVRYEGIEHIQPDDLEYARDLGLGLKLIGTAERIDGGLSVRVHPAFLYPGHPLASVNGPFNAVTVESPQITEITMSGPGAGGPQTASAVLGDVVSAMIPPASTPPTMQVLEIVQDVVSSFYLHLEVADQPGVLARVAQVLAEHEVSVKSVVQKGLADQARLVMVLHPVLESRFTAAMAEIAELAVLRTPPRAIRVLEEEFG